jgi:hypothetical protein
MKEACIIKEMSSYRGLRKKPDIKKIRFILKAPVSIMWSFFILNK